MKALKIKILQFESMTRPILVKATKPDKRYRVGFRETGKLIPKLVQSITLVTSFAPELIIGQIVFVHKFGNMRIMSIAKDENTTLVNIDMIEKEHGIINVKMDEAIDVLPLYMQCGEGGRL